ncbi:MULTISPECIES: ABC transporter substrate-binding protein [unclassified Plantibacter]|uniref:ABC transporter substrate-binding protein n=1 Tax=unclassified Plantibacter TaxID=2624265 RepID=UPI0039C9E0B3
MESPVPASSPLHPVRPASSGRRSARVVAVLAPAALLLAACSPAAPTATSTPVTGGTLVYASGDAEPDCLDPHVGGNYPQALLSSQYLEPLVSRDADGAIIPWLAESWTTSEDGLTWDFTLRSDVTFTDGTAFDAAAVKANVEHLQNPETKSSTGYLAVGKVAAVEAVDATTARFTLSTPDSALLESLSQPWTAMESPTGLARGLDANCEAPVGTGPFVVDEWVKQDHVSLVRNDAYDSAPADSAHEGPAYLDSITWRFIPDSASRFAALQSGDVDIIDNAQPDTIVQAKDSKTIVDLDAPRPGASNRIELNAGQAPFDDAGVREAFVRSTDVNAGIESLFFGTAKRSYSPLSSAEATAYSDDSLFGYDLDAANELLDAAGWTTKDADGVRTKDGVRLTVRFPVSTNQSIPAEQSLFEQIQAGAGEAGFDVQLELLDLSSWYEALGTNAYEAVSAPYTKVGPDVLRVLYDSAGIVPAPSGYFANHAQLDDPALDDILTQASDTLDPDERAFLYEQAQQIILDGYYILPLYDQQNHFLLSTSLQGVRALPTVSTPVFADAWLVE